MNKFKHTEHIKDLSRKLRKDQTDTEKIVWELLRNKKFKGLKFRRQHPFGRYIVDFYCPQHRLIIEIDGLIHEKNDQKEYDEIRQGTLESSRHRFIRIRVKDIEKDPKIVYRKIEKLLKL